MLSDEEDDIMVFIDICRNNVKSDFNEKFDNDIILKNDI